MSHKLKSIASAILMIAMAHTTSFAAEPESILTADSVSIVDENISTTADNNTTTSEPLHHKFWRTGFGRFLKGIDKWMEDGQRAGIDTTYQDIPKYNHQVYLGAYAYWQNYQMGLPMYMSNELRSQVPGLPQYGKYDINAHMTQLEMEIGIDWKGLTIELPIPLRNNYTRSFGLAKNGSVWGFRVRYKEMQRMEGTREFSDISALSNIMGEEGQAYRDWLENKEIDSRSNTVRIFYGEGYYVFNHKKFSLSAGLYADMIQKRSAGGFFVYGNYFQSRYSAEDLLAADYDSFRTQQVSLGFGYGYNFVLMGGRLVFHASVVPMFSLYSHLVHKKRFYEKDAEGNPTYSKEFYDMVYPATETDFYDAADNGRSHFRVNAFARFAANYSWNRYIFTFLFNYRHYGYSNSKKMTIRNQEADAQLNFCVRF